MPSAQSNCINAVYIALVTEWEKYEWSTTIPKLSYTFTSQSYIKIVGLSSECLPHKDALKSAEQRSQTLPTGVSWSSREWMSKRASGLREWHVNELAV